ncbi:MAG TPA: PQQ-binding-like beta-propeller repeat protein [Polyangiales bacterium]
MALRFKSIFLTTLPLLLQLGCDAPTGEGAAAAPLTQQDFSIKSPAIDPGTWVMAGHDALGHHHNTAETLIGAANAATLRPAWIFDNLNGEDLGALHGTPVVTDSAVYVGSNNGRFYALSLDGQLLWTYTTLEANPLLKALATPAPVGGQIPVLYGTPIVGGAVYSPKEDIVVFGDLDGNLYALDGTTGAEVWVKPQVDPHPLGGIVGNSLLLAGKNVVVGFAAIEDAALLIPQFLGIPYECCNHTGFVAAFDVKKGKEQWRFETIKPSDVQPLPASAAPFKLGPSGADIWGQPTYDEKCDTIYFGTGQNYSPKPTGGGTATSDAIVAVDAKKGKLKWIRQITADDIWVEGIPSPDANGKWTDQDFGDAVKIYDLPDGRRVVGAAQKSGAYTVLDAKTGALIKTTQIVQQANQLGGLQNGSAYGNGRVFVHGLDGSDPLSSTAPFTGIIRALSPDGATTLWNFPVPMSVMAAPLALANGVLWTILPISEQGFPNNPAQQFTLLGLHADSGQPVAGLRFPGRAISGPAVSNGRIYLVTGNRAIEALGANDHGSVIALELPPPPAP